MQNKRIHMFLKHHKNIEPQNQRLNLESVWRGNCNDLHYKINDFICFLILIKI